MKDKGKFKDSYYEYEEVICDGCNEVIDLSEAEGINEAIVIWNDHVRSEHQEVAQ